MKTSWADCIVTYIDLIGAKKAAMKREGSTLMRNLHKLIVNKLGDGSFQSVQHVYTWNDSVLVVSTVHKSASSFTSALKDLQRLKADIDYLCRSYAISVKGKLFPPIDAGGSDERITVLKSSSWAMANCFEIEHALKRHKASWYVDSWIVKNVSGLRPATQVEKVPMLPLKRQRQIHLYKDEHLFREVQLGLEPTAHGFLSAAAQPKRWTA